LPNPDAPSDRAASARAAIAAGAQILVMDDANPGWGDRGEQQRLVADLGRRVGRLDPVRTRCCTTVAPQQEVHRAPYGVQPGAKIQGQRSLAGPAHRDVAAADDRN
jgi:hypothetical protein